jgi:hypothetical protein
MVILDPHCGIKDDDTLWFVPKPTSFYAFFCDFSGLACYLITTYVDFRHKKISLDCSFIIFITHSIFTFWQSSEIPK